jgi:hypothetical protein
VYPNVHLYQDSTGAVDSGWRCLACARTGTGTKPKKAKPKKPKPAPTPKPARCGWGGTPKCSVVLEVGGGLCREHAALIREAFAGASSADDVDDHELDAVA